MEQDHNKLRRFLKLPEQHFVTSVELRGASYGLRQWLDMIGAIAEALVATRASSPLS